MGGVAKAFEDLGNAIADTFTLTFTGNLVKGNGNDTVNAAGLWGTIDTRGGNDTINAAGAALTIKTGSGNDTVNAAAGFLDIRDTTGNLTVNGGSGGTKIHKSGDGTVHYNGLSGYTGIFHDGAHGSINYRGAAAANEVLKRNAWSGNIDFRGAGANNRIESHSHKGNVYFAGAGIGNQITRNWAKKFDGSSGNITADGVGAETTIKSNVQTGNITVNGAAGYLDVQRIAEDGSNSTGNVTFNGASAYAKIRHKTQTGNTRVVGAVGYAEVSREWSGNYAASSGNVAMTGAGAVNRLFSNVRKGDMTFQGVGGLTLLVRGDTRGGAIESEAIRLRNSAKGAAESGADAKSVSESVATRTGGLLAASMSYKPKQIGTSSVHFNRKFAPPPPPPPAPPVSSGDVSFEGAGIANILIHSTDLGDTSFEGAGAANVIVRNGGKASNGNVTFDGAGIANVITHTTHRGNTTFRGAGGANVITRQGTAGSSGNVDFAGAGAANVITHLTDYGNLVFNGAGAANVVTRAGSTGNLTFTGAGVGNAITHSADGTTNVIAHGGANIVTKRGGGEANLTLSGGLNVATVLGEGEVANVNAVMAGVGNILTTDVSGKTTAKLVGGGNAVTVLDGTADVVSVGALNVITTADGADTIKAFGLANVITTQGTENDIQVYGAYSVVNELSVDGASDSDVELSPVEDTGNEGPLSGLRDALHSLATDGIDSLIDSAITGKEPTAAAIDNVTGELEANSEMMGGADVGDTSGDEELSQADIDQLAGEGIDVDARLASIGMDGSALTSTPEVAFDDDAEAKAPDADAILAETLQREGQAPEPVDVSLPDHSALKASYADKANTTGSSFDTQREQELDASGASEDDAAADEDEADDLKPILAGITGDDNKYIAGGFLSAFTLGAEDDFIVSIAAMNFLHTGAGNDTAIMMALFNLLFAGDGDDISIQVGGMNFADMGAGNDVSAQIGLGNITTKNGSGDLYAAMLGKVNALYHQTPDDGTAGPDDLTFAFMGGLLNVGHRQGDGRAIGIMVGKVNSFSQSGNGLYAAGLLGALNVATKHGDGEAIFVMGGKLNVATRVGNGLNVLIMGGVANVATVVGHGDTYGMMLGKGNVLTRVGSGNVGLAMLGKANVATIVNEAASDVVFIGALGKANVITVTGPANTYAVGYGSIANVVTAEGEGAFVSVLGGNLNVTTKVGASDYAVMANYGKLNVSTHAGDGTTVFMGHGKANISTKVGDGFTAGMMSGQGNVTTNVGNGLFITGSVAKASNQKTPATLEIPVDPAFTPDINVTDTNASVLFFIMDGIGDAFSTIILGAKDFDYLTKDKDSKYGIEKQLSKFNGSVVAPALESASEGVKSLSTKTGLQNVVDFAAEKTIAANLAIKVGDGDVFAVQYSEVKDGPVNGQTGTDGDDDDFVDIEDLPGPPPPTAEEAENAPPSYADYNAAQRPRRSRGSALFTNMRSMVSGLSSAPDQAKNKLADIKAAANKIKSVSANAVVQVGNGNTYTAQMGDLNVSIKVGSAKESKPVVIDEVTVDVPSGYIDVFQAALGQSNIAFEVNPDAILSDLTDIDTPWTTSLQVMKGSFNLAAKIGDGTTGRMLWGDTNIAAKVGHGNDYGAIVGSNNISVRVGDVDPQRDDHATLHPTVLQGFKVVVGRRNAVVEYGTSNDIFIVTSNPFSEQSSASKHENNYSLTKSMTDVFKENFPIYNLEESVNQILGLALVGFSPSVFNKNHKEMADGSLGKNWQKRTNGSQTNGLFGIFGNAGKTAKNTKKYFEGGADYLNGSDKNKDQINYEASSIGQDIKQAYEDMAGITDRAVKKGGNLVVGGEGSDVIVSVGPANIVFGDTFTSVLDFSIASLSTANAQAISFNEFLGFWANEEVERLDLDDDGNPKLDENGKQKLKNIYAPTGKLAYAVNGLINFLDYIQVSIDIGGTIPYESIGVLSGIEYNTDGSIENKFDESQFLNYFVRMFWAEYKVPTSIFGGLTGFVGTNIVAPGLSDHLETSQDWAKGLVDSFFGEAPDIEDHMVGGETTTAYQPDKSIGDQLGDLLNPQDGLPIITPFPNPTSLIALRENIGDILAIGNGGSIDNVIKTLQNLKPMQGDGDILAAFGDLNLQFGGHGDDIIFSAGQISKTYAGPGNDIAISVGKYNYVSGNQGDDTLVSVGSHNVLHDIAGNNTVFSFGDFVDVRTGNGNDFIAVYGSKTKIRGNNGFNAFTVMGSKNSIYLSGSNVVFAIGADNNYYVLGGEGSKNLIYNIGAASVTVSPGATGYAELGGGRVLGNSNDDFIAFTRGSQGGFLVGDVTSAEAAESLGFDLVDSELLDQIGLDNRSRDQILMRGTDVVAWGGNGGSKDRDIFIAGYGLKDSKIVDAGGSRLDFGDVTEDRIVIGERIGVGDYSAELRSTPMQFRREGDNLIISYADHAAFADGTAPLAPGELNEVTVESYFEYGGSQSAKIVLSLWHEDFEDGILAPWMTERESEINAAANDKRAEIHTFNNNTFTHHSYIMKDGVEALMSEVALIKSNKPDLSEAEVWRQAWSNQWDDEAGLWNADKAVKTVATTLDDDGKVTVVGGKRGEAIKDFKLALNSGLLIAGGIGDDTIKGGDLGDTLEGGLGTDTIYGAEGDDLLFGGAEGDVIYGGHGSDMFSAADLGADGVSIDLDIGEAVHGTDVDLLFEIENATGSAGDDTLRGAADANILIGGLGDDLLEGAAGDDQLIALDGDDSIDGGDGIDTAVLGDGDWEIDFEIGSAGNGSRNVSLASIEILETGGGDDSVTGGAGGQSLFGGEGDDTLIGGAGNDELVGDETTADEVDDAISSDDALFGGAGDDVFYGGRGNDLLDQRDMAVPGQDWGADVMYGGEGDDVFIVEAGAGRAVVKSEGHNAVSTDTLRLLGGVTSVDLWFNAQGDDLVVTDLRSNSEVAVLEGWASAGADERIDELETEHRRINGGGLQGLVNAMAQWTAEGGIQADRATALNNDPDFNSLLASSWQSPPPMA